MYFLAMKFLTTFIHFFNCLLHILFANPSLLHLFPAKQVLQSGLSSYSLNRDHVRNDDLSNKGVSTHLM